MTRRVVNGQQFTGYFHGTDEDSAAKIMVEGFHLRHMANGRDVGDGVYATKDRGWAGEHAFGMGDLEDDWNFERAKKGRVIEVELHPRNPHVGWPEDLKGKPEYEISEELQKRGHDAWIQPGSLAVAYDPSIVKPKRTMDFKEVNGFTPEEERNMQRGLESW